MTANMSTCGTFEMARLLSEYRILTTFHKYYTIEQYTEFFQTFDNPDMIVYTLGIRDDDKNQLLTMKQAGLLDRFSFLCVDVPNGYLERFTEYIAELRTICPNHIIIA
jgi:GMP reductase